MENYFGGYQPTPASETKRRLRSVSGLAVLPFLAGYLAFDYVKSKFLDKNPEIKTPAHKGDSLDNTLE